MTEPDGELLRKPSELDQSSRAERETFLAEYAPDPKIVAMFDHYAALLTEAAARTNLIAASTIPHLWQRHFSDSAQLVRYGVAGTRWLDLGAGAGFPGLVLAILGDEVDLVEATGKKAVFLREAAAALGVEKRVRVHHVRVEALPPWPTPLITARAFAPLPKLFDYGLPFAASWTRWVLPKGRAFADELRDARSAFRFSAELHPSRTAPEGRIVIAEGVERIGRQTRHREPKRRRR